MRILRRVVTGHNESGKSIVLFDGPPTNVLGGRISELWYTDESPASNLGNADTAVRVIQMEPPPNGSVFRYIEVPPEDESTLQDAADAIKSIGPNAMIDTSRHPGMHRTNTVDYVVLLSGTVTMLLDEGEVELQPFDVVVQRGTNHAWVNKGVEPALLLGVNLPARAL